VKHSNSSIAYADITTRDSAVSPTSVPIHHDLQRKKCSYLDTSANHTRQLAGLARGFGSAALLCPTRNHAAWLELHNDVLKRNEHTRPSAYVPYLSNELVCFRNGHSEE
jgi:hypothetical protein